MRVNIGKYINHIGPYQIADAIFFWCDKYPNDELVSRIDYKAREILGDYLADSWIKKFCEWIYYKQSRTIKVKIDDYDVWDMSHTLSIIILPMLIQFKKRKHSSGFVDPIDAPKKLRPTVKQMEKSWDSKAEARYSWLLDELIWTFTQLNDDDIENQFWIETGELDWDVLSVEDESTKPIRWKKKSKVDWIGLKKHNDRIDNGLRLFGKYFRTLWD